MPSSKKARTTPQPPEDNQRSDQVEPMHPGAKAEADEYADERRVKDSSRGAPATESEAPSAPGGATGEHSGQRTSAGPVPPESPDDDEKAPVTPTDEPMPPPIQDPPPDDRPRAPMVTRS